MAERRYLGYGAKQNISTTLKQTLSGTGTTALRITHGDHRVSSMQRIRAMQLLQMVIQLCASGNFRVDG